MTQLSLRKVLVLASVAILALSASCKKKEGSNGNGGTEAYKDIEKSFDTTEPAAEERKPVAGVNMADLEKHLAVRFESLVDKLPSPCGKAHSLRTSRNNDESCKRAPFAVNYVFELVKDGATSDEVKELFKLRFSESKALAFKYNAAMPHHGPTDASVKLVEFFDYGCPACSMMKPVIEEALKGYETDVVIFYKQFPLSAHPDSAVAAQAALAAHKQGKFDEMHNLLFANQHSHKSEDLKGYAEKIGIDLGNWEGQLLAAKPSVDADKAEGEEAGVTGTPALFINGRAYEGPSHPKYLKMWIAEQLARAI